MIRLESRVDRELSLFLKKHDLLDSPLSDMFKGIVEGARHSCAYETTSGPVIDLTSVNAHLDILERALNSYAVSRIANKEEPRIRVLCTHSFGVFESTPAEFLNFVFYRASTREPPVLQRVLGITSPSINYH